MENYTVVQLKQIARENNIKGYSKLKKKELYGLLVRERAIGASMGRSRARSRSPIRRKKSPVRRKSSSPVRRKKSPVRRKSSSPVRRKKSPVRRKSSSPVRGKGSVSDMKRWRAKELEIVCDKRTKHSGCRFSTKKELYDYLLTEKIISVGQKIPDLSAFYKERMFVIGSKKKAKERIDKARDDQLLYNRKKFTKKFKFSYIFWWSGDDTEYITGTVKNISSQKRLHELLIDIRFKEGFKRIKNKMCVGPIFDEIENDMIKKSRKSRSSAIRKINISSSFENACFENKIYLEFPVKQGTLNGSGLRVLLKHPKETKPYYLDFIEYLPARIL